MGGVDKGTLDTPATWPTCEQLPCKCLGKEGGLSQQEGREDSERLTLDRIHF